MVQLQFMFLCVIVRVCLKQLADTGPDEAFEGCGELNLSTSSVAQLLIMLGLCWELEMRWYHVHVFEKGVIHLVNELPHSEKIFTVKFGGFTTATG